MPALPILSRPAVGFVVEGKGEHSSYPSLVARIVGAPIEVPVAVAGGTGQLLANLEEHLDDLVRAKQPLSVVVTIDLADCISDGSCSDCAELRAKLEQVVAAWRVQRSRQSAFTLPEKVIVVIQVQKFETWWIADHVGLRSSGLFEFPESDVYWSQAEEVGSPDKWLRDRLIRPTNLKSIDVVKIIVSKLDPNRMREKSHSFDKFTREVNGAYEKWYAEALSQYDCC